MTETSRQEAGGSSVSPQWQDFAFWIGDDSDPVPAFIVRCRTAAQVYVITEALKAFLEPDTTIVIGGWRE